MRAREVAVAVFLLYSKMYECRQMEMNQLQELTSYALSTFHWIEVEAHVLELLGFDLNVTDALESTAKLELRIL